MHLATLSEVCDKGENPEDRVDASLVSKKCPNFANGESSFAWSWTGTAYGSTNAYILVAGDGRFSTNNGGRSNPIKALCY